VQLIGGEVHLYEVAAPANKEVAARGGVEADCVASCS
jgi:hypothetical protein